MIFWALKDAQLNTPKRPNSAGARLKRQKGDNIRNVLGVWGGTFWEERDRERQREKRPVIHTNCGLKSANVSITRCGCVARPSRTMYSTLADVRPKNKAGDDSQTFLSCP